VILGQLDLRDFKEKPVRKAHRESRVLKGIPEQQDFKASKVFKV
jgi:hypothetical protein